MRTGKSYHASSMAEVKARRGSGSRRPVPSPPCARGASVLPMLLAAPLFDGGTGATAADAPRAPETRQRRDPAATPAGYVIYREGDPADSMFIIGGGVVVSYKELASGQRRVAGFRFQTDIFGLAEDGALRQHHARGDSRHGVSHPGRALTAILKHDAELEFQFLCKVGRHHAPGAAQVDHRRAPRCGGTRGDVPRPAAAHRRQEAAAAAASSCR